MKLSLIVASLSLLLAGACKGELEGPEPSKKPPAEKKKSNVVKLTTAVPYGKHVKCSDLFKDPAVFTERIGDEIGEIKDKTASNSNSTSTCSFIRAGEPPETPKELKTLEDKYGKLGVLPGDEYCQVTTYCSIANDEETFKKKCEEDGNSPTTMDGQFACLRATEKGVEYSYTYKFIEPDTKCVVEAMAGPSVNEQELVQNCALAARDAMTKEGVANPY
jgi:hypothetical protein